MNQDVRFRFIRGAAGTDRRTLVINAACNWLTFAASAAIAFVVCPILVDGLGKDGYGIWELVQALVGWFALLDMGIGAAVVRYIAKFEALEEGEEISRVFNTTLAIFAVAGAVTLVACSLLALGWTQPFGLPVTTAATVRLLIVLMGATVALELVGGVFGAVLYGLGRFPARLVIQTSVRISSALAMAVAISLGGGLLSIATIGVVSTVVVGVLQFAAARYYLPQLRVSPAEVRWETFRAIRGYSLQAFIVMTAGHVSFRIDALVIGAFLAPAYVTYFVVAARLVEYGKQAIHSLTAVITPAASNHEARGNMDGLRGIYRVGSRYALWLAAPLQFGLIILGKDFLRIWLGAEVGEQSYPVLIVLSIPLCIAMSQVAGSRILYGIGKLGLFTWLAVLQAVANLVISVALVPYFGIVGVAWGTTLPNLLFSLGLCLLVCFELELDLRDYIQYVCPTPLIGAGAAALTWYVARLALAPDSWPELLTVGGFGLASIGAIFAFVEPDVRAAARSLLPLPRQA